MEGGGGVERSFRLLLVARRRESLRKRGRLLVVDSDDVLLQQRFLDTLKPNIGQIKMLVNKETDSCPATSLHWIEAFSGRMVILAESLVST